MCNVAQIVTAVLLVNAMIGASDAFFFAKMFGPSRELEAACPGTCQMCTGCWFRGGYITHHCGGLFICCESFAEPLVAQARNIEHGWTINFGQNSISGSGNGDSRLQEIKFGPVVNDPTCGRPKISRRRVVGGEAAGFGTYPWQAIIRVKKTRCGGALISSRHVVTAGHCVYGAHRKRIRVTLGEYTLYNEVAEPLPKQDFVALEVHLHPYYRFTPQADRYDVAVIRLDRRVAFEPHISPICLPEKLEAVPEGTVAMVAGWGATDPSSKERPVDLQAADVNVVNSTLCESWHRKNELKVRIYNDMLCAGHEDGKKDACQGDSGGPLMTRLRRKDSDGEGGDPRWFLIGLVSAGYSCAVPGQPGIYHKIPSSSDWISYVTRLSS